jgi:hypothetical protein
MGYSLHFLYIICDDIFRVDGKTGKYKNMTSSGNWRECCDGATIIGDIIYMVSNDSGYIYGWNVKKGNTITASDQDWSSFLPFTTVESLLLFFGNQEVWDINPKKNDWCNRLCDMKNDIKVVCYVPRWKTVLLTTSIV